MNNEQKANTNTVGSFEVKTDLRGDVRADVVSFDESADGFQVSIWEGVGGHMEPKKYFMLKFPPQTEIKHRYNVEELLGAKLLDYSPDYSFEYIPVEGWVDVTRTESAPKVEGEFSMSMKSVGEQTGPLNLKVTGTFNLKNKPDSNF